MDGLETNRPRKTHGANQVAEADLDAWLGAQVIVAWAGEGRGLPRSDARLGWWRSDMVSEFGGEDLFKRLLPRTAAWSTYQAALEGARRADAHARAKNHDPDRVLSLFHLGFELNERVAERLQKLKHAGKSPAEALPMLGVLVREGWDRERFLRWVREQGEARFETGPTGRRLTGSLPTRLGQRVQSLVAALAPLGSDYPLPYYRRDP